jgi:hypothetical protein
VSSYLFPYTLPGIQYGYTRKYNWGKVGVQKALSGKQSTIAYQIYPLISYEYSFEFLRDAVSATPDISALVGLFNAVGGKAGNFLHTDPDFNTISPAQSSIQGLIGTSTGSTATTYQLLAMYTPTTGGYSGVGASEIIQNLNGTPVLYDLTASTTISASTYSIGPTGIVTFSTSPPAGHLIGWSGSWYNRCRFDSDDYDFKRMDSKLWVLDKVNFTSLIL